jgi:hypothetical protein
MRIASYLAVTGLLLAALPARAQEKPSAAAKPAAGTTANSPAPAAGANAPAAAATGNGPAPTPAPSGGKTISVKVPSGGEYSAYIQENTAAAPKTLTDKADLDLPTTPQATVYVLDNKTGYAARKQVPVKTAPAELAFDSRDFTLVQKLKVTATGKDDKPIAKGNITLTDGGKNAIRKLIQPDSQGVAQFEFVHTGSGSVTVTAEDGNAVTKPVNIGLNPGEQAQSVSVSLPQVTATVAGAPGASPAPAPTASGNAPAPTTSPAPAPAPAPLPQPGSGVGGDFITNLVGFIILGLALWGGYVVLKNKGVTMDSALKKLGIQPDTVVAGGGSLAGASAAGPAAPPGPPPIVADPNQCPFCGQMKDAGGGCACQVIPGQAAVGGAAATAPAGSGPRLVGMAGTYMGTVFPINGVAVIGREPTNPVPLDRDTTASRKHAQITADGGGYRVQDLGSANGTFVNGAKVTETVLQPGDEVSIGGTRFRFEV